MEALGAWAAIWLCVVGLWFLVWHVLGLGKWWDRQPDREQIGILIILSVVAAIVLANCDKSTDDGSSTRDPFGQSEETGDW